MPKSPPAPYQLDLESYELRRGDGVRVNLERQPMELLIFLVERKGRLVTRKELAAHLWGDGIVVETEPAINNAVRKIRTALHDSPEKPKHLETVVGKGYRFIGEIEVIGLPVQPAPAAPPAASRWLTVRVIGMIVAVLAAALALGLGWGKFTRSPIRSIAVLPLDNLSGDPGQGYFADGLTDELTTNLARIGSLRVIARTSTKRYASRLMPVHQIARELGVDAVVEGSIVRSGNRVRVNAQLIDGRNDTHLWAQHYERDLGDILELQDSVALDIASQVNASLSPEARGAMGSHHKVKPAAYEAYLRGRAEIEKEAPESLPKSAVFFRHAIELDPVYAAAHAGLADSYSLMANFGEMTPREAFPQAEVSARKALELDPLLPESHAAVAFIKHHFHWDWQGAEAEYRRSVELTPGFSRAHLRYAWYLSECGRHPEALAEIQKARESDPLSLTIRTNVGGVFYYWRRYDDAIREFLDVLAIDPNRAMAHYGLGLAHEQKHMYPEAVADYERGNALTGLDGGFGLASAYAGSKRTADARRLLVALEKPPANSLIPWYFIAGIYGAMGDRDRAFSCLDKAYANRDFLLTDLKVDPRMDPLRADPRLARMLALIGLHDR
jgi:TolB-like protein/DNA-binding winged helix-turn-helix (wHTH) protein